jgi:lipoate-protein ligase A
MSSIVLPNDIALFQLESGSSSGFDNMRLDEALLEAVRENTTPILIVRTYEWDSPTLSLGVNQPPQDVDALLPRYRAPNGELPAVVRRPTGGRAILHGQDISYAFITNAANVLRQDVCTSYRFLNGFVRQALLNLEIPIGGVTDSDRSAEKKDSYTRSPVCFETRTSSDLLTHEGHKVAGSAQLRRQGGLLQHGSAFLASYGVSGKRFSNSLFNTIERTLRQPLSPLDTARFLQHHTMTAALPAR